MFGSVEEIVSQFIPVSLEPKDYDSMTELMLKSHASWRSIDAGLLYDISIVETTIRALENFITEKDAPELSKMMKDRKGQPASKKAANEDDDVVLV